MGPKSKSSVLTQAEEAVIVEFRRRILLPLDDVLGCLQDTIPNLSRSALHRCLQRHGISRLLAAETTEKRKRFKTYDIGYVHIDSAELAHADGKLVLFLAIDRVSKFTYVEFHEGAGKMEGATFLRNVIATLAQPVEPTFKDCDVPLVRAHWRQPRRRFQPAHRRGSVTTLLLQMTTGAGKTDAFCQGCPGGSGSEVSRERNTTDKQSGALYSFFPRHDLGRTPDQPQTISEQRGRAGASLYGARAGVGHSRFLARTGGVRITAQMRCALYPPITTITNGDAA